VDVYLSVMERLADMGVEWVQVDEPALALDLDTDARVLFTLAYDRIASATRRPKIMIVTYFGGIQHNLGLAKTLKSEGLHLDLVRAPEQLDAILDVAGEDLVLSLGVIDGRNIWRTDLDRALKLLKRAECAIGSERIQVAPSCSLLHCPIELDDETAMEADVREWLAFGKQKLQEVAALMRALNEGEPSVARIFKEAREAMVRRRKSLRVHITAVKERLTKVNDDMERRATPFTGRIKKQQKHLKLPLLPTTTIGSFPQTTDVRKLRADWKKEKLTNAQYEQALEQATIETIRFQEETGLDVLVHGEFERNDMVEYFGEQLEGYIFSQNGWVQSYGSRAVKPPIIFGDIQRPKAMTVRWSKFAQSQTRKPMKGMLTGPVTMLQWSFVRDDQPCSMTCEQLALAIRDEVCDLEAAGIRVIQIDEPAIREGLPLRRKDWGSYLDWAVRCFRLASSGVKDETQIHTHMCYSEFNDMIESIAALDADVISIEASRSRMELLKSFEHFVYPNAIGPGVYDIHSPRVPSQEEIVKLLRLAQRYVPLERLWVNPDCGLKTRGWAEVKPALVNMVEAAKIVRKEMKNEK
jgi:5-methyltetrahydropteroyltriglutamate--homocysteine methyltransferase